jgi:hypothetical protein
MYHELIWLQPDEVVPERECHMIQSEEVVLKIAWNPTGFHLIDFLSPEGKLNSTNYVTNILNPLAILAKLKSRRSIEN